MDTTDPDIHFDAHGVCSHCHEYDRSIRHYVIVGEEGRCRLERLADEIRAAGAGKRYDCVIGVSGGVDSTYTAYLVKQLGLRPLAVHLDNGWNSELAVANIHTALTKLGIDLHTHVIDWEEFKDLQIAFLEASTPDAEIPSDHAIFSLMSLTAAKHGLRYVIPGFNKRTESHLPRAWSQGHMDWKYIRSVHRQFGKVPLRTYPHLDWWACRRYGSRHRWISLLDYVDYVKNQAVALLEAELGWKNYSGKHYESIYTRFYQGHFLPKKFGYDKRKTHLSSLICSGEITREEALKALAEDTYDLALQQQDRTYVIKKFGWQESEFERIMDLPLKSYWDYPSYGKLAGNRAYRSARTVYRTVRSLGRLAPGGAA